MVTARAGRSRGSNFFLNGTLGQTAIGPAADGNWWLGQGYWYGMGAVARIYLPVVFKGWD